MSYEHVLVEQEGAVVTITMNRPAALNALNVGLGLDLARALNECQRDEVRAVVLRGAGRAFCAGGDVHEMAQALRGEGPEGLRRRLLDGAGQLHREVVAGMRRLPKPVIGCINGVAAGAGLSLALAADLRIAADTVRLLVAYPGIGATADGGSTYFLPRLVGLSRALELYMLNEPVDARRALEMGLVTLVVPEAELEGRTRELARRLASGPTWAFGQVKAMMGRAFEKDLAAQLEEETRTIGACGLTRDMQEGVIAFVEKRSARFEGR